MHSPIILRRAALTLACCALFSTTAIAGPVSSETLDSEWDFYGMGLRKVERGMFYMKEAMGSQGVMIVSPEAYGTDVSVSYEIMPMTAASVCVVILSASDAGEAETLTIPEDYDGSMGHWISNVENYFFAFHNASHNKTPFGIRFPEKQLIGKATEHVMRNGSFHKIKAIRSGDRFTLSIDGETLVDGMDASALDGGHIAFRIRGLSEEPAACLIKNLIIEANHE